MGRRKRRRSQRELGRCDGQYVCVLSDRQVFDLEMRFPRRERPISASEPDGVRAQMGITDSLVDVGLLGAAAICAGLLIAIAGHVVFYIFCGLTFMGVAAYTLLRGQMARQRKFKLAWFMATSAVLLLFGYWAMQVVFRPPKMKTDIGCGGVKFVGPDGKTMDTPFGNVEPMRTEL